VTPDVARHCRELDRCNQRGGRMLSLPDLLDAGTLDLDLAAYLMARVSRGASFIVGAWPGGAGKTTVMCALLNVAPVDAELVAATTQAVRAAVPDRKACHICHEIGPGSWFAYLWGADLRAYCALGLAGHMLATNLHADDLEEAQAQVCDDNGVPEAAFRRFRLAVFLRVTRNARVIDQVYESDGQGPHTRIFDRARGLMRHAESEHELACKTFLSRCVDHPIRAIEDVRAEFVRVFSCRTT